MPPRVIRKLKLWLVLALLALVPLRALAAVTVGLCPDHAGSTSGSELMAHHGAMHDDTSPQGDTSGSPSVCSLCTACCTGASFVPPAPSVLALGHADLERIPFFGRDPATPQPDRLDRPPLTS
jgi:hypothetical protein